MGGLFTSFNGTPRNHIARLNADGSLDTSFDPGSGFNNTVRSTSIQTDGKIIVGGLFTTFNGTPKHHIVRLNKDGSLDTTFNPGTGFDSWIESISIQSDGKIIVAGWFTSFNGTVSNQIARLNVDGSLDTSFNPGTGVSCPAHFSCHITSTSIQADGKIIVGGSFTSFNGTRLGRIARLNIDGSLDNDFNYGFGFNRTVSSISIQADGKIITGGDFDSYKNNTLGRIARILNCSPNTSETAFVNACDSFTWIDGITYTSNNNTATHKLTNASGCDSIVTLNLTITGTINADAPNDVFECDSFVLPNLSVGNYYTETNGGGTLLNAGDIITKSQTLYVNATNGSCSDENSFEITITNTPIADTLSNVTSCDSFELPNLSVGDYYTETNGGGTLLNAGDIITNSQTLYVYAANGTCSNENSFEVTINSSPANTVTISGDTLTADEADATYQWLDCDNGYAPISGETNQNFIPSVSGNFAVEITKDECTAISDCQSFKSSSVNKLSLIDFTAFPNPTKGELTILLGDKVYSDISVIVRNPIGQIITSKNYDATNTLHLNIDGVSGIYYVNILSEDINEVIKVVKF